MTAGVRNFKYYIMHNNERRFVCPKAFELIHGISRYWRKELTRDVNGASEIVRSRNKSSSACRVTKKQVARLLRNENLAGYDIHHIFAMGVMASTERTQSVGFNKFYRLDRCF